MANTVLLEARPFRPFKSSEEYLYAMKEDLAEWFHTLYPELGINVDNFMDRIDTGVALCKHANNVKLAAIEYVARRQARALTRSMTCSTISATATSSNVVANTPDVRYLALAKPSTFFARDNVSNFIDWCRNSLRIFECLLFETDDLILRKNEKHVILCLLEVARKGAKFGMLAPMLVQMERQIDREIAQEQRAGGGDTICDSDSESEEMEPPVIMVYGPQPQIVTNDLKSLDEMVRDLVERCTCPTQFPMIRVSEGKYRIGDTKVLIFVRILRSHVMVRVGGGWDTLSHYLDKHDPCRCRSQHRSALTSRLVNRPGAADLSGAQVYYERRSSVSSVCSNTGGQAQPVNHLLTPTLSSRNRSRSPTPSRKLSSQLLANESRARRSASPNPLRKSPNTQRKSLNVPGTNRLRSRSPTPSLFASDKHVASIKIQPDHPTHISETSLQILDNGTTTTTGENGSDNGSEISDEGYRSLGLIQNSSAETTKICNKINRLSLNSQNSLEDADFGERSSQNNSDSGSNNGDTKTIEEDTSITTVDGPNSDIYNETGLRKTYFSDAYYNDKKPETNVISKPRARSMEHNTSRSRSNSKEKIECGSSPIKRQSMAYRSVRERKPPVQNTSPIKSSMSPSRSNIAVMSKKSPNLNMREQSGNNTWSGRQSKQRPSLASDTFTPPPKAMTPPMNFSRNSAGRTSLSTNRGGVMYDNNGRRIIKNTSSANTSPTKQKSPLLEQIMKSAEESQNDAQMFEKIKDVLKQYSSLVNCDEQGLDFTSAWVQSQGCNETKRCSVVSDGVVSSSSGESSSTRNGSGMSYVSPRKDSKAVGQVSKIPAPVSYKRSTTDLY